MPPRTSLCFILLAVLLGSILPARASEPNEKDQPTDPRAVEVLFQDESVLRVRLADEKIEIQTKHGGLKVPADQINRIYFAQRIDTETQRTIDSAIAALTDPATADTAREQLPVSKSLPTRPCDSSRHARTRRVQIAPVNSRPSLNSDTSHASPPYARQT